MKKALFILLFIAVGVAGYKFHSNSNNNSDNPMEILNPVYLESRIEVDIPEISRQLELVFIGEMVSESDCQTRKVTQSYLSNLFKACTNCTVKMNKCHSNLDEHYKRLFSGHRTHTTYLSLDRGSRFGRSGRLIIWGLTRKEAGLVCQQMKKQVTEKYSGTLQCIADKDS